MYVAITEHCRQWRTNDFVMSQIAMRQILFVLAGMAMQKSIFPLSRNLWKMKTNTLNTNDC